MDVFHLQVAVCQTADIFLTTCVSNYGWEHNAVNDWLVNVLYKLANQVTGQYKSIAAESVIILLHEKLTDL